VITDTVVMFCTLVWCSIKQSMLCSVRAGGAWGSGGLHPLSRTKPLFFWQKLNFLGRSQQPKMKKTFVVSKRENCIRSV